jgi:hypothetical protein
MKVVPISPRKFDAITEFMLREGIPLTLKNYLDLAYFRPVRLRDLDAEALAAVPQWLLLRKYRRDVD